MCWSKFAKRKCDLTEVVEEFFNMLEKKGKFISLIEIKIRLDNAGEIYHCKKK